MRAAAWAFPLGILALGCRAASSPAPTPEFTAERISSAELHAEVTSGALAWVAPDRLMFPAPEGRSLWRIDLQGRLIDSIGRDGSGPGEYKFPVDVSLLRDGRVAALDEALARLYVYDDLARPPRSVQLPSGAWRILRGEPGRVLLLAGGLRALVSGHSLLAVDLSTGEARVVAAELGLPDPPALDGGGVLAPKIRSYVMPTVEDLFVFEGGDLSAPHLRVGADGVRKVGRVSPSAPVVPMSPAERATLSARIQTAMQRPTGQGPGSTDTAAVEEAIGTPTHSYLEVWSARAGEDGTIWVVRPPRGGDADSTLVELRDHTGTGIGHFRIGGRVSSFALREGSFAAIVVAADSTRKLEVFRVSPRVPPASQ